VTRIGELEESNKRLQETVVDYVCWWH
jgi:hypothetical protein